MDKPVPSDGNAGRPKGYGRWVGRIAIAIAAVLLLLLLVKASCSGFDNRSIVSSAMGESAPLRSRLEAFYLKRGALPQAADGAFRLEPSELKRARQIEWDATRRMIVVTMGERVYAGKRFGWYAEERDGRIEWSCRPLDLEPKYLPAGCR